jgi:hypothetical protein
MWRQPDAADNESPRLATTCSADIDVVSNTHSHVGISGSNSLKRS